MNVETQICITKICWEKIFLKSFMVLHVWQAEALTEFVPDYLFEVVYIIEWTCYLPWEQRADLFATQYNKDNASRLKIQQCCLQPLTKYWSSGSSEFLSCEAHPLYDRHPAARLPIIPMGLKEQENQHEHKCMLLVVPQATVSFSDPGFSCLWPASLKSRQADLVTWK